VQIGYRKIKGLSVELLIVWLQEGAEHDCSTNFGFSSLTTQPLNNGLKAFLCPLLSFGFLVFQPAILLLLPPISLRATITEVANNSKDC